MADLAVKKADGIKWGAKLGLLPAIKFRHFRPGSSFASEGTIRDIGSDINDCPEKGIPDSISRE